MSSGVGGVGGKGFTLLELIVVLAIAGLLAGVVAIGLGRGSQTRDQRNAISNLASELQLIRVEAMKRGEAVEAEIRVTPSGMTCVYGEKTRDFPCAGLVVSEIDGHVIEPGDSGDPGGWGGWVVFEADGRTRSRVIAFAGAGGSDTLLPRIEFDPISGAIELGRATEQSPRDQGGAER